LIFFCIEIRLLFFFFLQNLNFYFNFFFLQNLNFYFNFFFLQNLNFLKTNNLNFLKTNNLNYLKTNNLNYLKIFNKNINKYVISYFYNFVFFKINFKNYYYFNNSFLIICKYFFNILYQLVNLKTNLYIFDLNFKNSFFLYSYIYNKNFVKIYQNFFFFNINKIFRKNFYFFFRSFLNNNNISVMLFLEYKFAIKNIIELSKFNIPILNFSSFFVDFKHSDLSFFNFNYQFIYLFN
jgi:hypothetical protein